MFRMGLGFGMPGFMLLAMFLKFAVAAIIIVMVVKHLKKSGSSKNDALKILDCKFANGEINEEEYSARKAVLTQ